MFNYALLLITGTDYEKNTGVFMYQHMDCYIMRAYHINQRVFNRGEYNGIDVWSCQCTMYWGFYFYYLYRMLEVNSVNSISLMILY